MSNLIEAIERYETALRHVRKAQLSDACEHPGPELDEAESDLRESLHTGLGSASEGIEYGGTVYAEGFSDTGRPIVVRLQVRSAQDADLISLLQGDLAELMSAVQSRTIDQTDIVDRLSNMVDATILAPGNFDTGPIGWNGKSENAPASA